MKSLLITLCVRAPKVLMQPQLRKSYSNYTILQLFVFQKRVACGINFKHFVGARCTAMNILVQNTIYKINKRTQCALILPNHKIETQ